MARASRPHAAEVQDHHPPGSRIDLIEDPESFVDVEAKRRLPDRGLFAATAAFSSRQRDLAQAFSNRRPYRRAEPAESLLEVRGELEPVCLRRRHRIFLRDRL